MENQYQKHIVPLTIELPSHEVLAQLALNEPREFEALRSKIIKGFIDSAPERLKPRLFGIQFRVDGMRRLSKSPVGLTVRIYGMMWDSFLGLNQSWQEFVYMQSEFENMHVAMTGTENMSSKSAQVYEFRHRNLREHDF